MKSKISAETIELSIMHKYYIKCTMLHVKYLANKKLNIKYVYFEVVVVVVVVVLCLAIDQKENEVLSYCHRTHIVCFLNSSVIMLAYGYVSN